mgnify:CR=1 FL=1
MVRLSLLVHFLLLFLLFLLRGHQLVHNLLEGSLSDVLVAHLGREVCHLRHDELLNFEVGHARFFATFLWRRWLAFSGGCLARLSFLSCSLRLLGSHLSFILSKCSRLELRLLLLSLHAELLLDLLLAGLLVDLERAANVRLIIVIKNIHVFWLRVQNLDVFYVVVSESSLDLVQ